MFTSQLLEKCPSGCPIVNYVVNALLLQSKMELMTLQYWGISLRCPFIPLGRPAVYF